MTYGLLLANPYAQDRPGGPITLWPAIGSATANLPCGKCIGCKTDKATQWAQRCLHESSLWEHNAFATLTYDDEHLPQNGHLDPAHLRGYLKRLREHFSRQRKELAGDSRKGLRFFAAGEYGETLQRPHYHLITFNCSFNDLKKAGADLFTSETAHELWPHGQVKIGALTGASANYVARYTIRKQGQRDYDQDGVVRPAPFLRMSLRPAIGLEWLKRHHNDLQHGYLINNEGKKTPIPRYYRKKIRDQYADLHERIDKAQYDHYLATQSDSKNADRLKDAETIHKRRAQLYDATRKPL